MQKPTLTDWRSLYLYAVCFVCVAVGIITTLALVDNIMSLVYPSPPYIDPYATQPVAVDRAVLEEQNRLSEHRSGVVGLVGNLVAYALVIPLFLVHWRLANRVPPPDSNEQD
jgi:hypothetical protein